MAHKSLVCLQKQGERLVELGIVGDSLFSYYDSVLYYEGEEFTPLSAKEVIPAWTSGELEKALPLEIIMPDKTKRWLHEWDFNYKGKLKRIVEYSAMGEDDVGRAERETKVLAYADVLIHLIENELITVEEVNRRIEG